MPSVVTFDFDELLGDRRRDGRSELGAAVRALTADSLPDDASVADLDGSVFFEPRLFAQLFLPALFDSMTLDQLIASRATESQVRVRSDHNGVVVLPGLGLVGTSQTDRELLLDVDRRSRSIRVASEPQQLKVDEAAFIAGTEIELIAYLDPVLTEFLSQHVGPSPQIEMVDARDHGLLLERALNLIERVNPTYGRALAESVRGVVCYRHPSAESFAALGMHGLIFLNLPETPTLDYFVEELTHQGGHVLFSEATLARQDFFKVDPDSSLGDLIPGDTRDVYGFFHGLFTEHMECSVVGAILADGHLPREARDEFVEHLQAVSSRLDRDLALVQPVAEDLFEAPGHAIYEAFRAVKGA